MVHFRMGRLVGVWHQCSRTTSRRVSPFQPLPNDTQVADSKSIIPGLARSSTWCAKTSVLRHLQLMWLVTWIIYQGQGSGVSGKTFVFGKRNHWNHLTFQGWMGWIWVNACHFVSFVSGRDYLRELTSHRDKQRLVPQSRDTDPWILGHMWKVLLSLLSSDCSQAFRTKCIPHTYTYIIYKYIHIFWYTSLVDLLGFQFFIGFWSLK